jgi:hypothetical protein
MIFVDISASLQGQYAVRGIPARRGRRMAALCINAGAGADATVEATNQATGETYSATSSVDGYTLSGLPAGTYEIAVPPLGWKTVRFEQSDVGGPAPRLADGTRDLSGVWQADLDPDEAVPDLLP